MMREVNLAVDRLGNGELRLTFGHNTTGICPQSDATSWESRARALLSNLQLLERALSLNYSGRDESGIDDACRPNNSK
jgi:hypothetical protein